MYGHAVVPSYNKLLDKGPDVRAEVTLVLETPLWYDASSCALAACLSKLWNDCRECISGAFLRCASSCDILDLWPGLLNVGIVCICAAFLQSAWPCASSVHQLS